MKYYRFQIADVSKVTGQPLGLFAVVDRLKKAGQLSADNIAKHTRIVNWFETNLANPPFYETGNNEKCITWFKETSRTMLAMMEDLRVIARDSGVECRKVVTEDPGKIVYEDEFQIATKHL